MEALIIPFLKALVLVPVTLLPIINPLTTAPVFVAMFGSNRAVAKRLARRIAINSWFIMVVSMLAGNHVLALQSGRVLPALYSATASAANSSSFPAFESCSICASQARASNSANHARNAFSSSGVSFAIRSSSFSSSVMWAWCMG